MAWQASIDQTRSTETPETTDLILISALSSHGSFQLNQTAECWKITCSVTLIYIFFTTYKYSKVNLELLDLNY